MTGTIDITVTGGTTNYTYLWDGPGGPYTTEDLSGLGAGNYTLTLTDANGCIVNETVTVNEASSLDIDVLPTTDLLCNGDTNGAVNIDVTGGTPPYTYDWDNDGMGDNDDTEDLTDLPAGTYNITVTDDSGCAVFGSATITEPDALIATATDDAILCNGDADGDIDLTVTGGTMPYTYDWNNAPDVEDPSGLSGGIYTVTVTDMNGCAKYCTSTIISCRYIIRSG